MAGLGGRTAPFAPVDSPAEFSRATSRRSARPAFSRPAATAMTARASGGSPTGWGGSSQCSTCRSNRSLIYEGLVAVLRRVLGDPVPRPGRHNSPLLGFARERPRARHPPPARRFQHAPRSGHRFPTPAGLAAKVAGRRSAYVGGAGTSRYSSAPPMRVRCSTRWPRGSTTPATGRSRALAPASSKITSARSAACRSAPATAPRRRGRDGAT